MNNFDHEKLDVQYSKGRMLLIRIVAMLTKMTKILG